MRRLLATGPDEVVVIATGPVSSQFPPGTTGSLAGYGLPVTATLPGAAPLEAGVVPLGVTLGAWLLAGAGVPCSAITAGPDRPAAGPDRPDRRRALLVMGDGSARRSERAPGYVDPRAEAFDAAVATALATADAPALAALDPALGADLLADGVPAWRVAADAATGPYRAELLYDAAPYGVGYLVATWLAP